MSAPVSLTFPDGSVREYPAGSTGRDVAEAISKSLAKKAIAIALDGELRDLSDTVSNGRIEIVTREDDHALELIRHDAAHVMAEAVQELWPGTRESLKLVKHHNRADAALMIKWFLEKGPGRDVPQADVSS